MTSFLVSSAAGDLNKKKLLLVFLNVFLSP